MNIEINFPDAKLQRKIVKKDAGLQNSIPILRQHSS